MSKGIRPDRPGVGSGEPLSRGIRPDKPRGIRPDRPEKVLTGDKGGVRPDKPERPDPNMPCAGCEAPKETPIGGLQAKPDAGRPKRPRPDRPRPTRGIRPRRPRDTENDPY